jgi:hypothetical protein
VRRETPLAVLGDPPGDAASTFGVGVHLWGMPDDELERQLADLRRLGVRYVRTDAPWDQIEQTKRRYDFPADLERQVAAMRRFGMRPLLIADYANPLYDGGRTPDSADGIAAFARYAGALAAHYPDADVDIYNEFDFRSNTGRCGPSPSCYLQLLRPAAAAVRGAHGVVAAPSITGTGINAPWLDGFVAGGGLDSTDALALHPYVQPAAPESLDQQLQTLRTQLDGARHGDMAVWFTEFGYSTVPGWVSERTQAADSLRAELVARARGVSRIYWYDAVDDTPLPLDLESNFGLFRRPASFAPDALVPKPAAVALAVAARRLAGATFQDVTEDGTLRTTRFSTPRGLVSALVSTLGVRSVPVPAGSVALTATGARAPTRSGRVEIGGEPVWEVPVAG